MQDAGSVWPYAGAKTLFMLILKADPTAVLTLLKPGNVARLICFFTRPESGSLCHADRELGTAVGPPITFAPCVKLSASLMRPSAIPIQIGRWAIFPQTSNWP